MRDDGVSSHSPGTAPPPGGPWEVARLFLGLGLIGFGGPAAHIALMEDEVVRRRRWLTREEFLDLLGATNLIPGPNSTEMAIHVGFVRAGWPGLVAGGACFILPAMLITLALAVAYVRYGGLPEAAWLLYGVKPVIIAVVVQAMWGLARKVLATPVAAVMALGVLILALRGVDEVALLFAAALGLPLIRAIATGGSARALAPAGLVALAGAAGPASSAGGTAAASASLSEIALIFLKVGSILFGSGYVLLAFLRPDLVERTGWLTDAQLLDAVAVGQFTPGPVLTTATFVGYLVAGLPGGLLATAAIFLPSFVFVALSSAASVALMATVTWELGRAAVVDWLTAGLAGAAAALLLLTRLNSAWLVAGGAVVGALAALLR
jgi:chromate transporter